MGALWVLQIPYSRLLLCSVQGFGTSVTGNADCKTWVELQRDFGPPRASSRRVSKNLRGSKRLGALFWYPFPFFRADMDDRGPVDRNERRKYRVVPRARTPRVSVFLLVLLFLLLQNQ